MPKQVGDPRRVRRFVERLLMESDRERVGSGSGGMCRVANASTALESMPPLRNMPSGTSLMRRRRTACDRSARNSSPSAGSSPGRKIVARLDPELPVSLAANSTGPDVDCSSSDLPGSFAHTAVERSAAPGCSCRRNISAGPRVERPARCTDADSSAVSSLREGEECRHWRYSRAASSRSDRARGRGAAPSIVDRKREHAVQPLGKSLAPLLVAVDQHFGVRMIARRRRWPRDTSSSRSST